jgi:3-hydroxyisobutyrate dehydrogenase-like beta-hydroxyacid dehydrogenase
LLRNGFAVHYASWQADLKGKPMSNVTQPTVVGVLGLGAMGAGVAADLKRSGIEVVSTLAGRSGKTQARAEAAGVRLLADLAQVVRAADTFLSIVPADQAEPLAAAVAERLNGKLLHYVDCNSITPSKTLRIAKVIENAGATFSDGGIIGPPPGGKMRTRLYVSGPGANVLTSLQSERMAVIPLGESLSQATEMKVLFAAANKGATALLINVLAAANKVGLLDQVTGEIDAIRPGLLGSVRDSVPELDDKAARWAIEMDDLSLGLADMGVHGGYHVAAGESYRRLAANLADLDPDQGEVMDRVLKAWAGPKLG